jgi:hypothetical protein
VLGFSHIAWALGQVTRGGGKENFVWGLSQQQDFDELKKFFFSSPVLSLPDLQHAFEIETNASDYVVCIVDHFSKMAIMVTCKKKITREATTNLFFECIWVHFGIPQTTISD